MFPTLQVGPLALQVPGLVLLLGLWLGLSLAERQSPQHGINPNSLYNLVLISLVSGAIGARLAFAFRYPSAFAASPLSLVSLNPGLLDPWAGAAIGLLAGLVYIQRKNLPLWPVLDALVPAFGLMAVAAGLAHLASGSAFGAPAKLPWAIELWGARRHPSQVYEIIAAILVLWATWPGRGIIPAHLAEIPGIRFLSFFALSAAARLFLEAFHGDSLLLFAGLRTVQVLAWAVLAFCLWGLGKRVFARGPQSGKDDQLTDSHSP